MHKKSLNVMQSEKLLEMACARVDESYKFKKGKSRSKQYKSMIPAPKKKTD